MRLSSRSYEGSMKSLGKTKKKIRKWCPGGGKLIGCDCHNDIKKYVRCGTCGQRFEPYFRTFFQNIGEKTWYMPPHKAY